MIRQHWLDSGMNPSKHIFGQAPASPPPCPPAAAATGVLRLRLLRGERIEGVLAAAANELIGITNGMNASGNTPHTISKPWVTVYCAVQIQY